VSSLRNKAISGASWSLLGKILQQGTQFIIGIILARLLVPEVYGLVGMAMVFITISYVFIDSGFSSAIVQRKNITNLDLSTVFYLNMGVSVVVYTIVFFTAPLISSFFGEPQLVNIVRVLGLIILLYAFSLVQLSIIRRNVNFKLRTRIELVAQILSGAVGVFLAYKGFGVWALIWKTILNQLLINLQLWLHNNWFPSFEFSKKSFKELFSFSSKLLVSGIIDRIYQQIHRLIVGKFFPTKELGLYTRAEQFKNLLSRTVSNSLMSFLLPVFSKMQDEPERLKKAARRVLKIVMFFNINALIIMGIVADPMINVLLGDKWLGSVVYLQLLIFVGIFYPMHSINVQILTALGRSDLFLKIEVIKKIIGVPAILLGIFVSIKAMIIGMIFSSIASLLVNTHYTKKMINFGFIEQMKSLSHSFLIALILILILFPLEYFIATYFSSLSVLLIITSLAMLIVLVMSRLLKMEEFFELKSIAQNIIKKKN
jgi:O-antigen/teichoic acid export membrane protein